MHRAQVLEQFHEWDSTLYIVFVDYEKASTDPLSGSSYSTV